MIETRELPIVAEPTTPIKPSEALRLGRLIRPRPCILAFDGEDAACALGAIHVGWGGNVTDGDEYDLTPTLDRLVALGIADPYRISSRFFFGYHKGTGDAWAIAYLEARGL